MQIALYCKHADFPQWNPNAAPSKKIRFDAGEVLQGCVTVLKRCGVTLQNLGDLSPKNALTVTRVWRQRGDTEGSIGWRVSILRMHFRMLGRRAPLLDAGSCAF